jgi:hypothetical protein
MGSDFMHLDYLRYVRLDFLTSIQILIGTLLLAMILALLPSSVTSLAEEGDMNIALKAC